jgi:hypothetical protein
MVVKGDHGGTVTYMAPELTLYGYENSRTTDMYSFGTICWEVLTQALPWEKYMGKKEMIRARAIESGEKLDYSLLPPDLPSAVSQLIKACLEYHPHQSFVEGDEARGQVRPKCSQALKVLTDACATFGKKKDIFLSYSWGDRKKRSLFSSFTDGSLLQINSQNHASGMLTMREYTLQPLAFQIYKELRNLKFTVWMDLFDMGNDLKESMRDGIANSRCVVILLSPNYIKSRNCRFEMDEALKANIPIIVCMVCDPDTEIWCKVNDAKTCKDENEHFFFNSVAQKLNMFSKKYCSMHRAVPLNWTSQTLSKAQREMLTNDEGFKGLRKLLDDERITGTDDSCGGEGEYEGGPTVLHPPNIEHVEKVADLLAEGEEEEQSPPHELKSQSISSNYTQSTASLSTTSTSISTTLTSQMFYNRLPLYGEEYGVGNEDVLWRGGEHSDEQTSTFADNDNDNDNYCTDKDAKSGHASHLDWNIK